jgi:hypothetical protein
MKGMSAADDALWDAGQVRIPAIMAACIARDKETASRRLGTHFGVRLSFSLLVTPPFMPYQHRRE